MGETDECIYVLILVRDKRGRIGYLEREQQEDIFSLGMGVGGEEGSGMVRGGQAELRSEG